MIIESFLKMKFEEIYSKSVISSIRMEHNPIFPYVPGYTKLIYLGFWSSWDLEWIEVTEWIISFTKYLSINGPKFCKNHSFWLNLAHKSMHTISSWQSFTGLYRKGPSINSTWTANPIDCYHGDAEKMY